LLSAPDTVIVGILATQGTSRKLVTAVLLIATPDVNPDHFDCHSETDHNRRWGGM